MFLTARESLEDATYTRSQVDRFLDPNQPNWAVFDAELGYRLRDSVMKDGLDGCYTIAHYPPTGERRMINYAGKPCRINTYGDSFTQCHQVSDGETWQEYLAAHFGEPVRNFGVGGYGVYQAYRRMLREEATQSAAKYIILNIWEDDHFRSLDVWRWLRIVDWRKWFRTTDGRMFHCNPWAHLRIDPDTGQVVERGNLYPTPESLYQLCDKDYVYETFRDDLVVQVLLAQNKGTMTYTAELARLAAVFGIPADFSDPEARQKTAQAVYQTCALRASMWIVDKVEAFVREKGKELMIFLTYGTRSITDACAGRPRFDQGFLDFLKEKGIPIVDGWEKHVEDFKSFNLSPEAYIRRYYIGHYNPQGNHFFAFAVKDALVHWLHPKPITYRGAEESQYVLAAALA